MIATIMIALPSAVKVFNWLGTIWQANIQYTTAMLNALAFVSLFVIGGLSGIFMAATPVDIYIHDTMFIVAHIHYVLFDSSLFGIFAGIYYWFPKMFGRLMNEALGKTHFFLTFVFANGTIFPMHILSVAGQPQRCSDPSQLSFLDNVQGLNQFVSICAFLLGLLQIIFFVNFFYSLFWDPRPAAIPGTAIRSNGDTLPPATAISDVAPCCSSGPYEYAEPTGRDSPAMGTAPAWRFCPPAARQ